MDGSSHQLLHGEQARPALISSSALGWPLVGVERHAPRAMTVVAYPDGIPHHAAYLCDHATHCELVLDGETIPLRTGDAVFLPAGTPLACRRGEDAMYTRLTISAELVAALPEAKRLTAMRDVRAASAIGAAARELIALTLRADARARRVEAEAVASGFLRRLAAPRASSPRRLTAAQLACVEARATADAGHAIAVADLAAAAGLERHEFSVRMRETTGDTPHRWLMLRRVERVHAMLVGPEQLGLAEIAVRAGFSDQAHMTRVFRRETGITPAAFRRQA